MKRLLLIFSMLIWPTLASAQLTTMPIPLAQWFDNSGGVLSSGGLCVFRAGTTTLATTYTTAAGTVANANPILFDSAGRPSTGGVFLTPGASYKFLLKNFVNVIGTPTCVPDTGTTLWSVDNVVAVSPSSINVDVTGTAGVSFTAGQVAQLSDGSAGGTPGQWYLANANVASTSALPLIAVATTAISAGAAGSFRISGEVTGLVGLTPGADYYVSATPGAMTATQPASLVRWIGRSVSSTSIDINPNPRSTPIKPHDPCGRLTLVSGTAVTTVNATAATTIYFAPYKGCTTATLYDGTAYWYEINFTQISIAVPAVANQMYDVFLVDDGADPVASLELAAWSSDTTRATALVLQDGVPVKSGATTRLYLGSFRTTTVAGQTEDSESKRYVWNYFNRMPRSLVRKESTANWAWNTAGWHQANASTSNQVEFVVGVQQALVRANLLHAAQQSAVAVEGVAAALALDSTTTPGALFSSASLWDNAGNIGPTFMTAIYNEYPAIGRHFLAWLEYGSANSIFFGVGPGNVGPAFQTGISGWIEGD